MIRTPAVKRHRRLLERLAVVSSLTVATYALQGYAYPFWPQPTVLEYVLHYRGALVHDWFTSLPPPHWAFDHVLAWVPGGALHATLIVLWIAQSALLWFGFTALCETLGLKTASSLAAGLIAIPTSLDGVGDSGALIQYTYPTALAFALAVCALAAALAGRLALAGIAVGAAIAFHPEMGVLALAVLLPALLLAPGSLRDKSLSFVPGLAIVGGAPFVEALRTQAGGTTLSAHRRFQLVAVIRHPHHMLYSSFPHREYIHTIAWLAVLALAASILRARRTTRVLAAVSAAVVALCAAGAIASAAGRPLELVEIQTARITPLIVVLGIVLGATALVTASTAGPVLLALLALCVVPAGHHASVLQRLVAHTSAHRTLSNVDESSLLALGLLVLLALVAGLVRLRTLHLSSARVARAATLGLSALALVLLVGDTRRRQSTGVEQALSAPDWIAVAHAARAASRPADVVLTPPTVDSFRFWSRRPIVVDFGDFRFGKGEDEWARRIEAVTADPHALDVGPNRWTGSLSRVLTERRRLGNEYERAVASSTATVCRYQARFVVANSGPRHGSWLIEIYHNATYALFRVRNGACA